MQKRKTFRNIRFDSKALSELETAIRSAASQKVKYRNLDVLSSDATWSFDTLAEFLAAVDQGVPWFTVASDDGTFELTIVYLDDASGAAVWVRAATREQIESIFAIVERNAGGCSDT